MSRAPDHAANDAEARLSFERERLPTHVRTAAAVGFVINAVFAVVDEYAYPEHLALFLPMRLALSALCAVIYFRTASTAPRGSSYAFSLGFGGAMLAMVYATGGPTSDYFAGIVLVLVGIGVLLPLPLRPAIAIALSIVVPYAAAPLFTSVPFETREYVIRLMAVVSGALEFVWSVAFLDGLRLKDFKQRRELEVARDHLKEMDHLKSRFSANIHHELRTPLTLMMVPVETILGGQLGDCPPRVTEYLATVKANGLRLQKLINNLLDMAKLESKQMVMVRRPMNLAERIESIANGARPMVEQKSIALLTKLDAADPVVNADADAVEKIVLNLLGNALKFTPEGGQISLELSSQADGDGLHVIVRDSGVGIPADQLERVFDRFAQVDSSSTRRFEGTGIGLSLCLELVNLHGGRIWAESDGEGCGTRMNFILPLGEADAEADPMLESGEQDAGAVEIALDDANVGESMYEDVGRHVARLADERAPLESGAGPDRFGGGADRPTVVLAEDNPDMRKVLRFLLAEEFEVVVTRNGREALEAARISEPDLVITDVMMPEMSGTELCMAIKADDDLKSIPVMLLTSKAERELKIQGLEMGADDYVTKPFHPRELLARARSLVRLTVLSKELASQNQALEDTLIELRETQSHLVHREKMASLGRFVAGIAHELNNPLNFLQGNLYHLNRYTDLLARAVKRYEEALTMLGEAQVDLVSEVRSDLDLEEVDSELRPTFEGCETGLKRSNALVSDLRSFSRKDTFEPLPMDLHECIESTLRLVGSRLANVRIIRDFGELPEVECVGGQIHQIVVNLVVNAIDAMRGRGNLTLRTRCLEDRIVSLEVQDSGPGIDPEHAARIFDPFFTTKGQGEGTGLGLSISYGIATRHGGTLAVSSTENDGACFRLELPITAA